MANSCFIINSFLLLLIYSLSPLKLQLFFYSVGCRVGFLRYVRKTQQGRFTWLNFIHSPKLSPIPPPGAQTVSPIIDHTTSPFLKSNRLWPTSFIIRLHLTLKLTFVSLLNIWSTITHSFTELFPTLLSCEHTLRLDTSKEYEPIETSLSYKWTQSSHPRQLTYSRIQPPCKPCKPLSHINKPP